MPSNTRELKRRIKSTKSIKQITKAMEMIAASKMRKAQNAALSSRPYANLAWEMLLSLRQAHTSKGTPPLPHALLKQGNPKVPQLVIVISPNRGLCGSLPSQLVVRALDTAGDEETRFVVVGRKTQRTFEKRGKNIEAYFDGFETQPTAEETRPIADIAIRMFTNGEVSHATIVYANFISTLQYRVQAMPLLPIETREGELGSVIPHEPEPSDNERAERKAPQGPLEFLFEPEPQAVLDQLLPRIIELQIYQAVLEGLASEHSARMVMMQNASKSADDLIDDLSLTYNTARQDAITAELLDITGGRLALEK